MDYPKFSSFEVQVTIGEGKSAVAGAEPPLRGNPIARAPSSVWSRLVDHTERREAGDTQDTQEEEEEVVEEEVLILSEWLSARGMLPFFPGAFPVL